MSEMDAVAMKNFASEGSERNVHELISRLRFISKLEPGEKLGVQSLIIQPDTWTTTVLRTVSGDSRNATLGFIQDVLNAAFELTALYLSKSDVFYHNIGVAILDALVESMTGIRNLEKTYQQDKLFVSRVQTELSLLQTKIDTLRQCHGVEHQQQPALLVDQCGVTQPPPRRVSRTGSSDSD